MQSLFCSFLYLTYILYHTFNKKSIVIFVNFFTIFCASTDPRSVGSGSGKIDPGYWIKYLRQKIAYAGPDRRKELGRSCRRRIRINISGNLDQKIGSDQSKRIFALERTDRSLARVTRGRAAQLYHGRNFLSSRKLKKDPKSTNKIICQDQFYENISRNK